MKKYIKIELRDDIGAGSQYQKECLFHEAKKIGLEIEYYEVEE